MKAKRNILSDQEGVALVFVALMMVVIMGMATLVVDVGTLTKSKRQLVATADAAALAGVQELADVPRVGDATYDAKLAEAIVKAKNKAAEYAAINYPGVTADIGNMTIVYSPTEKSLKVPLVKDGIGLTFAKILGHEFGSVSASAKAVIVYVDTLETDGHSGNVLPFGLYFTAYNELDEDEEFKLQTKDGTIVKNEEGDLASGNWGTVGFYDMNGKLQGGNDVLKYLCSGGYEGSNPGDLNVAVNVELSTDPGAKVSATDALANRLIREAVSGLVPIYEQGFDKNGRATSIIKGFAMVRIISAEKDEIVAALSPKEFITDFKGTTTSTETDYNRNAKVVLLTK